MPKGVIVSESERKARFRAAHRLHRPGEFTAVMSAKQVIRGESFDLHFGRIAGDEAPRLGLIVPKRLARAASLRNALKRQGREAFRLATSLPGCDLVLRLKRPLKDASADKLQRGVWRREIEVLLNALRARS